MAERREVTQCERRRDDGSRPRQSEGGEKSGHILEDEAFVTMITSDDFAIGAELMLHSLREHSCIRRPQVVMVTAGVSQIKRLALEVVADRVIEVRCTTSISRFTCSAQFGSFRAHNTIS